MPDPADRAYLPPPEEPPPSRTPYPSPWLPLLLLLVSLVTTAATGALLMQNFRLGQPPLVREGDLFPLVWIWKHPSALLSGWSFSLALLSILLAHEAGHYVLCRRHGIRASWPYVLPAPTLSGTAGAVIRIRSRIPSRRALMEVGVAGPIAGYLVALCTTVIGLMLSRSTPDATAGALVQFHWPLTIALLDRLLPGVPAMANLLPHPVLIASWVGLFVTSLNLIPAGQLDGGHILYAISAEWHRRLRYVVPAVLLVMGLTLWTGWLIWGVILLLPAMRHPAVPFFPLMPYEHRWLGAVALVILLLTLLPAPFAGISGLDLFR